MKISQFDLSLVDTGRWHATLALTDGPLTLRIESVITPPLPATLGLIEASLLQQAHRLLQDHAAAHPQAPG